MRKSEKKIIGGDKKAAEFKKTPKIKLSSPTSQLDIGDNLSKVPSNEVVTEKITKTNPKKKAELTDNQLDESVNSVSQGNKPTPKPETTKSKSIKSEKGGKVPLKRKKSKKKRKNAKKKEKTTSELYLKKVFSVSPERYSQIKDFLSRRGDRFDLISSGSSEKMVFEGKTYSQFTRKSFDDNGFHLVAKVKKDVNVWLNKIVSEEGVEPALTNADVMFKRNRDYMEQLFCLENIEKHIGQVMIAIDINDCFWQTIYNQGVITKKTYEQGLLDENWKIGRNASIGSLNKITTSTTYENGVALIGDDGKVVRDIKTRDLIYQHVRHNVVGAVCDITLELADALGDKFCMCLVDCVFTTTDKLDFVREFLSGYGYAVKFKVFEFTALDRKNKYIEWRILKDYDAENKGLKSYRYSERQLFTPINFNLNK